ncbi:response regulator [Oceanobacillus iheyensis]|uniref:Two-component response regulator n=1 Tax=Oceanobacillus iheyensis (strain DSM 14371 / CIP 107618 / JCM 11309 / KCTC 3954 / HTE831) TaxID=221109 RepID=Q8ELH7_OCEIH|nr:response regulator [Oceanobacillus iheyensis]BAC15206.1 two-component response regulator [Oceanobacillus iheyensis HTE831]
MNVLVAEDDYRVADIHCQYLEKFQDIQYIERAATAYETLAKLKENKFDLLLLDVYLPDELGINMIETYKQEHAALQIILITAATDIEMLKKAYLSGVIDYLIKPIALDRLADAINKAVKNHQFIRSQGEFTQQLADQLFQNQQEIMEKQEYPKGIDELTLKKVNEVLQKQSSGMTADQVGKDIGVSRTTARRYLEYLISVGKAKAELEYGIVGRPERKYVTQ